LKTEIEEGTRRWKGLLCSWTGRIDTVKMAIILKAVQRSKAIPIKIPMLSFTEIEKSVLKFLWKHKGPQMAQSPFAILSKKRNAGIRYMSVPLEHHEARCPLDSL
jgi:hypothetical protein